MSGLFTATVNSLISVALMTIQFRDLQLATAAAYILTDHGLIIGLIHQGAAMSHGKTILSPGQLEHFGCRVHDKALTVTGLDPYFVTPMVSGCHGHPVRATLCPTRPPNDQELSDSSIPHVDLTSPHAWDPSCLDSVPADEWFLQQDKPSTMMGSSHWTPWAT
ncbi:Retrotransposon protein [Seminavis robusta]|uniref:Retrotransposon protein n=1 Tax=Seminavis robusta TaxID=568900 RepID=A0A9N8DWU1_9STRA|nr:Retrotransposon protein [Seminavis robusta]|eukprot:Sro422_g139700.1 Retrotransposon protein (163) ;mRNA; f:67133-67621